MISIWHETTWSKQLLFIVTGGLILSLLGALLVCPTGPGSSRILFAMLAGYALLLLLLGPKFTKITAFVLLCIFLAAFAMSTRSKNSFEEEMRARVEQMKTFDGTTARKSTPLEGQHKEETSRPGH